MLARESISVVAAHISKPSVTDQIFSEVSMVVVVDMVEATDRVIDTEVDSKDKDSADTVVEHGIKVVSVAKEEAMVMQLQILSETQNATPIMTTRLSVRFTDANGICKNMAMPQKTMLLAESMIKA